MSKPKKPEVCPECGIDLAGIDPWAHALDHWPEQIPNPQQNKDAVKKQKWLRDLAKKRGLM